VNQLLEEVTINQEGQLTLDPMRARSRLPIGFLIQTIGTTRPEATN